MLWQLLCRNQLRKVVVVDEVDGVQVLRKRKGSSKQCINSLAVRGFAAVLGLFVDFH
jgi:hypothetical protein